MEDSAAATIEDRAQVNVDVPVLVGLERLHEARSLFGSTLVPPVDHPGLAQHAPDGRGGDGHLVDEVASQDGDLLLGGELAGGLAGH